MGWQDRGKDISRGLPAWSAVMVLLNIADTIHFKWLKLKESLPLEKHPPAPKYDQWGN